MLPSFMEPTLISTTITNIDWNVVFFYILYGKTPVVFLSCGVWKYLSMTFHVVGPQVHGVCGTAFNSESLERVSSSLS